jgi:hypothetical protein
VAQLGTKFDQKKFHDFILAQGLLPPDLMREAVVEDFISSVVTRRRAVRSLADRRPSFRNEQRPLCL